MKVGDFYLYIPASNIYRIVRVDGNYANIVNVRTGRLLHNVFVDAFISSSIYLANDSVIPQSQLFQLYPEFFI